MKRSLLLLCLIAVSVSIARAGTENYASKEVAPQPCPAWYADKEWNLSLWGTYAFTANDYPTGDDTVFIEGGRRFNPPFSGREPDTYLQADHAWGGGIDVKYFFKRYFGIGLQGFALDARRSFGDVIFLPSPPGTIGSRIGVETLHDARIVGSLLGTFTVRYPIGCSRFAPYLWLGGGMIAGGGERDIIILRDIPAGAIVERLHRDSETKAMGQFGGGFEVRLTPHIGLLNDFSWNVISGANNNFGMARTGINFAF